MTDKVLPEQQRFYAEVGARIRQARHQHVPRLTQDELAKKVGLTRTSITNVEQGRQKCLLHTLAEIAAALHVVSGSLIPKPDDLPIDLDGALSAHTPSEQAWIMSAVTATRKENNTYGS